VFVVDDEPDVADLLCTILAGDGFEVEVATDGRSALAGILGDPPDLAIVDLMMPGLDGFELLSLLRTDDRTANVPIVILSARTGSHEQLETLKLGASAYVFKPFSPRDLLRQVHQLLDEDVEGSGA
jgi:DNA-binding response OmpR family regulator